MVLVHNRKTQLKFGTPLMQMSVAMHDKASTILRIAASNQIAYDKTALQIIA